MDSSKNPHVWTCPNGGYGKNVIRDVYSFRKVYSQGTKLMGPGNKTHCKESNVRGSLEPSWVTAGNISVFSTSDDKRLLELVDKKALEQNKFQTESEPLNELVNIRVLFRRSHKPNRTTSPTPRTTRQLTETRQPANQPPPVVP
jgi:hypothetical protein